MAASILLHRHHIMFTLKKSILLGTVIIILSVAYCTFAVAVPNYLQYPPSHQFVSSHNEQTLYDAEHDTSQLRYSSKTQSNEENDDMQNNNIKNQRRNSKATIDDDASAVDAAANTNDYNNNKNSKEYHDTYHATIQRSLEHKHHIEYQYDQITYAEDSQQRALNTLSRILTRMEYRNMEYDTKQINNNNNDVKNNQRNLQNEFENAFGQGKPGSNYGYNMFCGSSWAEASTSCPQRQNCPSGQSSECVMPGHECWAFTECDTRRGDGEQFSEHHNIIPGENLSGSGVGAASNGGYVDLSKPSIDKSDHYFCGKGYEDAITRCGTHCPSGNMNDCPYGEICFTNTPCDARLMTLAPAPPSPTQRPTTPAPVVYLSKLNKYYCGYDWDDAQERCEVWCPSGSDDDCPGDQVCMAFTACHAVDMNGMTLAQIEAQQGLNGSPSPTRQDSVPGYYDQMEGGTKRPTRNPTQRPTKRPVLTAEEAMHRYSFCGAYWVDARDNCDTKDHCEDDGDCPSGEQCWTQTPCDYYATEPPTTPMPTRRPTFEPTAPRPTRSPTRR